jgi:hypothetical protein
VLFPVANARVSAAIAILSLQTVDPYALATAGMDVAKVVYGNVEFPTRYSVTACSRSISEYVALASEGEDGAELADVVL